MQADQEREGTGALDVAPGAGELPDPHFLQGKDAEGEVESAEEGAVHPDKEQVAVVPFHRCQGDQGYGWKRERDFLKIVNETQQIPKRPKRQFAIVGEQND